MEQSGAEVASELVPGLTVAPEDEERYRALERRLLDEIAAWAARTEPGAAFDRHGMFVCGALLGWKWGYADGRLCEWRTADVDEFFLDYAPRKLPSDAEVVADAPACAAAFFRALEEAGLLGGDPCAGLAARCKALAGEYSRAAQDRSRWGPAKALFAQMETEGIDTSDQGSLDAWIADFNSRDRSERDAVLGHTDRRLAEALTGDPEAALPWELGGALEPEPGGGAPAFAIGWFRREDYEVALERWPELGELWSGIGHPEYCLRMELTFRGWAACGHRPKLVALALEDYVGWCEERGEDPAEARPAYAAEMLRLGCAASWPPGRNDPCWCGAGRKYKKCCGAASGSALHPLHASI